MSAHEKEETIIQAQAELSRHESSGEPESSSDIFKFQKPTKRPRNDTRSIKNRSKDQERGIARSYGSAGFKAAKRVPGSGALAGLPADVDPGEWLLVECKETRSGRLTIDTEWVDKVRSQAKSIGRPWWALHTWVADSTGNYRKIAIMEEDNLLHLLRLLKDYETAIQ